MSANEVAEKKTTPSFMIIWAVNLLVSLQKRELGIQWSTSQISLFMTSFKERKAVSLILWNLLRGKAVKYQERNGVNSRHISFEQCRMVQCVI